MRRRSENMQREHSEGIEYTIALQNKDQDTITLVQYRNRQDEIFVPGTRVLVQVAGTCQRILPADDVPQSRQESTNIERAPARGRRMRGAKLTLLTD
jgi:hypothetical protein